ncbi:MAG: carbon-nitrogen family hydrolase [Caldilineae bacterium]|nr:carbon-nitrogen family hydrolase [Chloroflexota bacterium]MCB9177485.1 carbon-nitrogen family hydrolase [Caldilineae bacterium]
MLHVAGLQTDIAWEAPELNFSRATALAERAAAAGAQLLVLPEMFATGFSMATPVVTPFAEATREFLGALAVRLGCWVLAGYPEPGDGVATDSRARNAASVFDPRGVEQLRYHKVHPFSLAGEDRVYAGGDRIDSITIEGLRVTPLICYDLRFGEIFRARAETTDLFVVIANWPEARREHWRILLRARAIENQAWLLGVNRVGEGDGLRYAGDTMLVDPLGDVQASAAGQSALICARVDPSRVAEVRARFGFLADRRPSVYRSL